VKLLERVRDKVRRKHYSYRTEQCYLRWIERFIRFHKQGDIWRHPADLGAREVEQFLTHLATQRHVSESTQNQALAALLFLYEHVLEKNLGPLDALRAQRRRRMPVVLSRTEVRQLLDALDRLPTEEPYALMARLMYGTGLRAMECCRLRVEDVDVERRLIAVRSGKGDKDRIVMLPESTVAGLTSQLAWRATLHEKDLRRGLAWVAMPDALDVKYPGAEKSLAWQFVFASTRLSKDPAATTSGDTTFTKGLCNGRLRAWCGDWAGTNAPVATRCDTVSPPTCSRWARTSAACKSCWATTTSAPR
jgi:integron integrase